MAVIISSSIQSQGYFPIHLISSPMRPNSPLHVKFKYPTRGIPNQRFRSRDCKACCSQGYTAGIGISADPVYMVAAESVKKLVVMDLDPATAKLAIAICGPFLSAFAFLFVIRIVMSWYPNLPVGKFPYVIAYAPTEPILIPTRKLVPPLGGVDVTPVIWFGLLSFLNEILVGPQGLLVLLSQQV